MIDSLEETCGRTIEVELSNLLAGGEAVLQKAVDDQEVETLTLDFKEVGQGKDALFAEGKLTKQGALVIGPALSAFANSAGGLLVAGVRCKPIDGIDAASELLPIADLKRCQSSLSGQLGAMLQPRHDGLALHAVTSATAKDSGYLVIEVPRSDRRPHMAQIDHHYYKRSGASTFVMEHYDVEDAFRRIAAPRLELKHQLRWRMRTGGGETKQRMVLGLALANVGEVSARDVTLAISEREGGQFEIVGQIISGFGETSTVTQQPALAVHPGETRHVADVEFYAWGSPGEVLRYGPGPQFATSVEFTASISAEHMRPLVERVVVTLAMGQEHWG